MTQEQALQALREIYPDNKHLAVSREREIGHRNTDQYFAWNWTGYRCEILARSDRSWEHMLAIAKSGNEDIWPEDKSAWEDEQVSAE